MCRGGLRKLENRVTKRARGTPCDGLGVSRRPSSADADPWVRYLVAACFAWVLDAQVGERQQGGRIFSPDPALAAGVPVDSVYSFPAPPARADTGTSGRRVVACGRAEGRAELVVDQLRGLRQPLVRHRPRTLHGLPSHVRRRRPLRPPPRRSGMREPRAARHGQAPQDRRLGAASPHRQTSRPGLSAASGIASSRDRTGRSTATVSG